MSSLDPFYLVKEEAEDALKKLQAQYARWERMQPGASDTVQLGQELLSGFESISWQVDELDRAISVAEKDPGRFSVDAAEISRRRKWTSATRGQIGSMRRPVLGSTPRKASSGAANRQELLRMPSGRAGGKINQAVVQDNQNMINSESERQALILKEQDQDLDELSASVERIGGVGLVIHEELQGQERLIDELGHDVETTASRLDFVQKKLEVIMKRAGLKGQIGMIGFLILLLLVLIWLVFN